MSFPQKVSVLVARFTLVIVLGRVALLGQGTIRGVVTDSVTNTPLVGANVYLLGTALGGTTDLEGKYTITRVPEGAYTLKVSYVGYKPKEVGITVSNTEITLDARLTPDIILGPEVVVTAQARGRS